MKRITEWTPKGATLKLHLPHNDLEAAQQVQDCFRAALNRLAEYEDTGLSPEQIRELQKGKQK